MFSLKEVFFDMGEKLGFANCVVEKLCSSEKPILWCFQQNTAVAIRKLYVEKNRKCMKNRGLFLNMAKWCFGGLFFEGLMVLWFVFCVSGIVAKVLKMLVFFPSLLGFCVVAYSLFIWVWKV